MAATCKFLTTTARVCIRFGNERPLPTLPIGQRIYAIGDIHGCLGLLKKLLVKIDAESEAAGLKPIRLFLGDYIDRGLESAATIQYCIDLQKTDPGAIFLLGNHEMIFRSLLKKFDDNLFASWMTVGGRETLMSYGVPLAALSQAPDDLYADIKAKVPEAHKQFLNSRPLHYSAGDYYFCHAGVKPGRPLAEQLERDLLWIRKEFLSSEVPFGKIVVHGHTVRPKAEFKPNRIGIDTGAYATGCLTALGLEGQKQWLVQTR